MRKRRKSEILFICTSEWESVMDYETSGEVMNSRAILIIESLLIYLNEMEN